MTDEFEKFREEENYWLRDYALYSLLKKKNGERCWADWPAELADRDGAALARFEAECAEELSFIEFTQFIFFRQLGALSAYCAELGVELMGDARFPPTAQSSASSLWVTRRYMSHGTARTYGPRANFSTSSRMAGRAASRACRRTISARRGSAGAIRCINGRRCAATASPGGARVCAIF